MNFSQEQTNIAKGVAICLMFVHHLCSFSDRPLNGDDYIPAIPFLNLEQRLAFNLSWARVLLGFGLLLVSCLLLRLRFELSGIKLDFLIVLLFIYFSTRVLNSGGSSSAIIKVLCKF